MDLGKGKRPAVWKTWLAGGLVVAIATLIVVQVVGLTKSLAPTPTMSATAKPLAAPDLDASAPRVATYSNIYKYDYVGAETCGKCHAQNYESWRGHPHSVMNRNATAATVVGNFGGGRLDYGGSAVVFSKGAGEYTMTLYHHDQFVRQLRVTRVVGSRFVQMYIGVQSKGPEPPNDSAYTEEVKLPFAYWIERDEWFPQTYDELVGGEYDANGELSQGYAFHKKQVGPWKKICAKCHNTYPYASRLLKAPNNRLAGFPANDIKLKTDITASISDLESWELVQMGIGCESCHFGGREHALEGAAISFVPKSQDLELSATARELTVPKPPAKRNNHAVNAICNQCHSAEGMGTFANGASIWNSREASDFMVSKCASTAACTNCHNPHRAGPVPGGGPDAPNHIEACLGCHEKYRAKDAMRTHFGHTEATKMTCLDCHMPRIVHGLSGFVRSHDITSPADPRMLTNDQPNACNMCHLDRSIAWTVEALDAKWQAKPALKQPPSNEPVGKVWLGAKEPALRGVAVDAHSRTANTNARASLPLLAPSLEDPSPSNRMFAVLAFERILGRRIGVAEYTPWAPLSVRRSQAANLTK